MYRSLNIKLYTTYWLYVVTYNISTVSNPPSIFEIYCQNNISLKDNVKVVFLLNYT